MTDLWVKIPVSFAADLPSDRPYTPLEAMYSLQLDRLFNKPNSIRGYARMWSWPKSNVARFLEKLTISTPKNNTIKTEQKPGTRAGQSRGKDGTPKQRKNNKLEDDMGQLRDSGGTVAVPNYKERKKENLYEHIFGRQAD